MYVSCCYKLLIIDADYLYHCFSWTESNEFVRGEERQLVQSDGRGRCRLITSVSHFHFVSILGESCQLMIFFFILDESCHRSLWHFEHVWCCVKINHKFLKVKCWMIDDLFLPSFIWKFHKNSPRIKLNCLKLISEQLHRGGKNIYWKGNV